MNRPHPETLDETMAKCERLRRPLSRELDQGKRFVVGGRHGDWVTAAERVKDIGGEVAAFHDSRKKTRGGKKNGIDVLRGKLPRRFAGLPYLFAGEPSKQWFSPAPSFVESCIWDVEPREAHQRGKAMPRLLQQHRERVERVFQHLADGPSRLQFASIVKARVEGDTSFHRISRYAEYDHPIVRPTQGDVAIDVGAFRGETTVRFARSVGARGRVYSLEPEPSNHARLCAATSDLFNVAPIAFGAWDDTRVLSFQGGRGGASRLSSEGEIRVPVTSIDQLVRRYRIPRVDLIKLDVEGAEKRVLEGARQTIRRHRPKLQVSIYHHKPDLFELPELLIDWLPGYRFYLGHHSYYHVETDIYAVPVEKWARGYLARSSRRWALRLLGRSPERGTSTS